MRRRVLVVGLAFLVLCCAFVGAGALVFRSMLEPVPKGATVLVDIPIGSTVQSVAEILVKKNLIRNEWAFRLVVRLEKADGLLKAGEYELRQGLSIQQILEILIKGQSVTYPFTVPEGLTVAQTADLLESRGLVDRETFLRVAREEPLNVEYLPEGFDGAEPMEGYLFPETYRVSGRATEEEILAIMYRQFRRTVASLEERAQQIGLSMHEVVTLASIIEREAMVDGERTTISGVYHNRLRIGMKLDADPTVLYAHGRIDGLVTYEDLEIDSPYNTYRYAGLPPGPIASPGEASIRAALYPEEVDYLYFLSRNDGTHVFSRTYSEHRRNKAQYQPER